MKAGKGDVRTRERDDSAEPAWPGAGGRHVLGAGVSAPAVAMPAGGELAHGEAAPLRARPTPDSADLGVPEYLRTHYWWAYVHPRAVRVFERAWLVDLILWGNYQRLAEAALTALGKVLPGRSLQIACVYGDLTRRMCSRIAAGDGQLDVVDVLPVQLANLRAKLPADAPVRLLRQNSSALAMPDASYDRALLFFLLHEQPAEVRRKTLAEALRVVRPGGRIVIVDFARPHRWHPMRYLWLPVLHRLEPFAHDLWADDGESWIPTTGQVQSVTRTTFFGSLYQMVTITR